MSRQRKRKAPVELKVVYEEDSSDEIEAGSSDDDSPLAVGMAALAVEAADFELPDGWVPEPVDTKTADAVTPVDYDTLTLKELRSMCAARGLSKTGTKMVLRARLQLCDTVGLQWSKSDISTTLPPFDRPCGPAHLLRSGRPRSAPADPYRGRPGPLREIDYFQMLVTSEIIDLLVAETIRYARQFGDVEFTTDTAEMKAFIGVMIWQGWKRLNEDVLA